MDGNIVVEIAKRMMDKNSRERAEAERMMNSKFEDMTMAQRKLAAACMAAFADTLGYGKDGQNGR